MKEYEQVTSRKAGHTEGTMISASKQTTIQVLSTFVNLPRTKGWPYLLTWGHRISGIMLVIYLCAHVFTLSSLPTPEKFTQKMDLFTTIFPGFLDWFLAIPVIFHSLNGGRLILYELYGQRNERFMIRTVLIVSALYLLFLALFMVRGDQAVSPLFFWSQVFVYSCGLTAAALSRLKSHRASIFWRLQRLSGVFLILLVPAHMLFMHLDPAVGRDVQIISERMSSLFIKCVDIGLLISALYHGSYGVVSVCYDYVANIRGRRICLAATALFGVMLAFAGLKMTLFI